MLKSHLFSVFFKVKKYRNCFCLDVVYMDEQMMLPYRTEEWDTTEDMTRRSLTHIQQAEAKIAKILGCRRSEIEITKIHKIHNNLIQ